MEGGWGPGGHPSKGPAVGPRLHPAALTSAMPPLRVSPSPTNTQRLALLRLPQAPDPWPLPSELPCDLCLPACCLLLWDYWNQVTPQGPPSLIRCGFCDVRVR